MSGENDTRDIHSGPIPNQINERREHEAPVENFFPPRSCDTRGDVPDDRSGQVIVLWVYKLGHNTFRLDFKYELGQNDLVQEVSNVEYPRGKEVSANYPPKPVCIPLGCIPPPFRGNQSFFLLLRSILFRGLSVIMPSCWAHVQPRKARGIAPVQLI